MGFGCIKHERVVNHGIWMHKTGVVNHGIWMHKTGVVNHAIWMHKTHSVPLKHHSQPDSNQTATWLSTDRLYVLMYVLLNKISLQNTNSIKEYLVVKITCHFALLQ